MLTAILSLLVLGAFGNIETDIPAYIFSHVTPTSTTGPTFHRQFSALGMYTNSAGRSRITLLGGTTPASKLPLPLDTDLLDFESNGVDESYSDIWRFNFSTLSWSQLTTLSYAQYADCSYQDATSNLYLYGGAMANASSSFFLKLDLSVDSPTQFVAYGNVSLAEQYTVSAACTILDSKFYVFGGSSRDQKPNLTAEIRTIDLTDVTAKTSVLTTTGAPKARVGASLRTHNETHLVMTGGMFADGTSESSVVVWRFNTKTGQWTTDNVTGTTPPPRAYHMSAVFEDSLVIFGGFNHVTKNALNDLWSYNLVTGVWTQETPSTDYALPPASFGFGHVSSGRRVFLYGGSADSSADSFWQLVPEISCTAINNSCGKCILNDNCGVCTNGTASVCVAGDVSGPYINSTCTAQFHIEPLFCRRNTPPPAWVIPVTASILGGTVVLLIVAYILDKRKSLEIGYEYIS